jgi:hypothetical protein
MVSDPAAPRPRSVTVALGLIIASYSVSVLIAVVRLLTTTQSAQQQSRWLTLGLLLVLYALVAGLVAALVYRRRWAWWLWIVLFVFSLPSLWTGLLSSLDHGSFGLARYLLAMAADIAAAVLLLLRPAREWYGIRRKTGEPSPWRMSDNPKNS